MLSSRLVETKSNLEGHQKFFHHNPIMYTHGGSKVNFTSSEKFFARVSGSHHTFISTDNVINQLIHAFSHASSYDALGKFGDCSRSSRVALSFSQSNSYVSFVLSKLLICIITQSCPLKHQSIVGHSY